MSLAGKERARALELGLGLGLRLGLGLGLGLRLGLGLELGLGLGPVDRTKVRAILLLLTPPTLKSLGTSQPTCKVTVLQVVVLTQQRSSPNR